MKKTILFLILVFFLTSCTSLYITNDYPSWYEKIPNKKNLITFVSMGSASEIKEAENNAYNNLLDNISAFLGYDIGAKYYRELISLGSIEDLSLYIDKKEYSENVYLLAYADRESITGQQSDQKKNSIKIISEVKELINLALESYKRNEDINSINYYLDALELYFDNNIEPDDIFYEIIDRLLEICKNIKIEAKEKDGKIHLKVKREKGLLNPSIKYASLIVSYDILTLKGDIETVLIPLTTDEKGLYIFDYFYPTSFLKGNITFNVNLITRVNEINLKSGNNILSDLISILNDNLLNMYYDLKEEFGDFHILVDIDEYENNKLLESNYTQEAVYNYIKALGFNVSQVDLEEDDLEMLKNLANKYHSNATHLIWARSELSESILTCTGLSFLIDLSTGDIIAENEDIRIVKLDENQEIECLEEWAREVASTYIAIIR